MERFREFYEPEIETIDREKLERLQLERLRWQVKRCYEGSEFYREKYDRVGLKPEDIRSLEDVKNDLVAESKNSERIGDGHRRGSLTNVNCTELISVE